MTATANLSNEETIALFEQYVIPNYLRYPISLVRGEGSFVWDAQGRRYLDFFPGWGCNILGYSPPPIVRAIQEQAAQLIHVPNTWHIENQGRFAEALCSRSFGKAFFCNSGAEANEAALKLARLHTPEDRFKIITFENSFHGRTFATVTATAQPKYHEGLGPMMAGFRYSPWNDLDAVRDLIDDQTCAIMIEPIQGEGGINIPAEGFLQGLRTLCDEHGLLLIFDEVQTGLARTGEWFAYQHSGVQPDIMTLAKGLAAGMACGAMIANTDIAPSLRPGMHASTFGGNPLAMAAGLAAVQMIEDENLLANCAEMSERIRTHFESLSQEIPIIREIRVCGMMIGIDLTVPSLPMVGRCMNKGVLVNSTHDSVVRFLPALNITTEQVDEGCAIVAAELKALAEES